MVYCVPNRVCSPCCVSTEILGRKSRCHEFDRLPMNRMPRFPIRLSMPMIYLTLLSDREKSQVNLSRSNRAYRKRDARLEPADQTLVACAQNGRNEQDDQYEASSNQALTRLLIRTVIRNVPSKVRGRVGDSPSRG